MSKIKAFTIMETIIVLVISAILVGVAYLSYTVISRSYANYIKKTDATNRITLLDKALTMDMNRSGAVKLNGKGFDCIRKDTIVNYILADSFLIRSQSNIQAIDTFLVEIDSLIFGYEGKIQYEQGGVIDQVTVQLQYQGAALLLLKQKRYSAESMMMTN